MITKAQYVKDYLKLAFPKVCVGGKHQPAVLLPSILSITADLIDIHNCSSNKRECRRVFIQCEEDNRLFYIYDCEHCRIYDQPTNLPNNLQIGNQGSFQGSFSIIIEIEGLTIIQHYLDYEEQCGYSKASYVEILSTIFFFCPHILWVAIKEEFEDTSLDESVIKAIHNCLAFYIILEDIEADANGEVHRNKNQILMRINNAKMIPQIENMVFNGTIDRQKDKGEILDHAIQIIQIGGMGIQVIREKLINIGIGKRKLKKVLGVNNYRKMLLYNKNTFLRK